MINKFSLCDILKNSRVDLVDIFLGERWGKRILLFIVMWWVFIFLELIVEVVIIRKGLCKVRKDVEEKYFV